MEKLYLGIELDDKGCSLAWFDSNKKTAQTLSDGNNPVKIPGYLSLNTITAEWCTGEEALAQKGIDGCIVLKNPVALFRNKKKLKVDKEIFTSEDMIFAFLKDVLYKAVSLTGIQIIGSLSICMEKVTVSEAERLSHVCGRLGIETGSIHILNRQECFMYYQMSRNKETWSNTSYLLDYSADGLNCYELNMIKGLHPITAVVKKTKVTSAPLVEFLNESSEKRQASDRWFANFTEKTMSGKIVSSILLYGEGFASFDWADQFLKSISRQKCDKVYLVENIYGMGAALAAYHASKNYEEFPYICLCSGRVGVTISIFIDDNDSGKQLLLVESGKNCYEAKATVVLNLIEQTQLDLYVKKTGAAEGYSLSLDLSCFMTENQERTKIRLSLAFLDSEIMVVRIEDLGFGEIYPSTGRIIERKYTV